MNNTAKIIGATALGLGIAIGIPVLGQGNGYGYGMGQMHGAYGGGYGAGHMMGYGGMPYGQMHGAYGGGYGAGHHMMGSGGMPYGLMHFGGNIEEHLSDVKTALQLTTEQQPVWDQFEQAVKSMSTNGPWNSGMGYMGGDPDTHFTQMQAHFTQMKAVFDAHKALYDSLSEQQKEVLNNNLPGPFGQHCGYNNC